MSDTPRTDAEEYAGTIDNDVGFDYVSSVFARKLERELTAALAERDAARECVREACKVPTTLVTPNATLNRWRAATGLDGE